MTDKDYSFLPNLIDEGIYVIKEGVSEDKGPTTTIEATTESMVEAESEPIVERNQPEPVVEESPEVYVSPLPTEGQNLKHCIVFVESDEKILDDNSKTFLANVLKAVKRSLDDVLLTNLKGATPEQIEALLAGENHRHVISFGTDKLEQTRQLDLYQVHSESHKFYLKADTLSQVSSNVDMKKALWTALQEMFLK